MRRNCKDTFGKFQVARHYLRGWFVLDIVSLIPWDLIELLSGSGVRQV